MENRIQILENLEKVFSKIYDTVLKPNDLRIAVEIPDQKDTAILMEISFLNDEEIGNDRFIQIYTTIMFNYNTEYTNEILVRLNELSPKFMLGNFGIYTPMNHIYHKYSMYISNPDNITCIHDISVACDKIINAVCFAYDYIAQISDNPQSITLDDYIKNKNLFEQ